MSRAAHTAAQLVLLLFMLLPLTTQAQDIHIDDIDKELPENDITTRQTQAQAQPDTTEHPVFRFFEKAITTNLKLKQQLADSLNIDVEELEQLSPRKKKRFIRGFLGNQIDKLNDIDTFYIQPQQYDYAVMMQNTNTFEEFTVSSASDKNQTLKFAPRPTFRLGGYFGWRWLFLGYTFDIGRVFTNDRTSSQRTEFDLSIYTSRLGFDIFYRDTGNGFRLSNLNSLFSDSSPRPEGLSSHFEGLSIKVRGINVYYIFNYRHFSYPAAYSQSTVQRKSSGSFMLGFSFSHHRVSFKESAIKTLLRPYIDESLLFDNVKYNDYSLHAGYGYNFVPRRHWLINLSLMPGLAYNATFYHTQDDNNKVKERQHFPDFRLDKLNFDMVLRAAVVYNNSKYFAGASFILHSFDYKNSTVRLNNSFGSLNFYVGFNFKKKKIRP